MRARYLALSMTFLSIFEGCVSRVPRPSAEVCWVNAPGGRKECFNVKTDYDDLGNRLPDAKPKIVHITGLQDLNINLCVDIPSQKALSAYRTEVNAWIDNHCQCR